ncbi:trehalose utilization protein ThuA [Halogeometricum borinquense]|uniref:Trehalose utilization protein n=2 Tax=Halogeometricum borinquense TaxID=60847 RepID=E4NMD8_HALBP|nr:trehalose utilization protein ThuA [Halogeometricum borinquense]ADQ67343.1 trehalose utilization protein [Halogeometricum borinquense DSM 11551]ELY28558.1 trehalose utilization protein [Halogeometricum borinquense DSM 11551]QIB76430.1 trehalose utilization protein ThuA [Halogeometricum borinquense]QIQ77750.1 trehalose utilization protein ThuA [Halogeometricum borinquense]RYJ13647.1 trehalose utilization protein ThuA [Halogeometricum borinquense]
MSADLSITVWNEYRHERDSDDVAAVYPDGIHEAIAEGFEERGFDTRTATLDDPEHGLTEGVLDDTDVLTWWGHRAHDAVSDHIVERVVERVHDGMGLLVLHSAHYSKPFKSLMGTSCSLKWREADERERIWVIEPGHPIAEGLPEQIEIPEAEMYGERFDVPAPDELVFTSWFEGGEVFRSGCCYTRGSGRVFYFRPGHETYPIYYRDDIRDVLANAAEWAAPTDGPDPNFGNADPLEALSD